MATTKRTKKYSKPTIKTRWAGQPGNKFRVWEVTVDGKKYQHSENRDSAHRQYDAAMRVYKLLNKKK